jgi:hypothetical protein
MRGSVKGERRGGRQPGVPNKRTVALAQAQAAAAAKVTQALGSTAFDGDALALLQMLYRDKAQSVETRLHAAKAAIAYEKPRLQSIALAGADFGPIEIRKLEKLTDEELDQLEAIQRKLVAAH